jgi:hypothetical protein
VPGQVDTLATFSTQIAMGTLLDAVFLPDTGDVLFASAQSSNIMAMSSTGAVRVFAGSQTWQSGLADGDVLRAALFNAPQSIARRNSDGAIFVADTGNNVIRHVVAGTVSTFAGAVGGSVGKVRAPDVDGPAGVATFNGPSGLAFDDASNLFVTESLIGVIRKVHPSGNTSTIAGGGNSNGAWNGVGTNSYFLAPRGIAFSAAYGMLVVGDGCLLRIVALPGGSVSTLAGAVDGLGQCTLAVVDGLGTAATFMGLSSIAVDSAGLIYVTDGQAVRTVTPLTGLVKTLAGQLYSYASVDGIGSSASFYTPGGLAFDASFSNLFVGQNSQVRRVALRSLPAQSAALSLAVTAPGLLPAPIVNVSTVSTATGVSFVPYFAFDPIDSSVTYAVDAQTGAICKVSASGSKNVLLAYSAAWGGVVVGGSVKQSVRGLVANSSGAVFFSLTNSVHVITSAGSAALVAGSLGSSGFADGDGTSARFGAISGIALDAASGSLYIADNGNNVVRMISAAGNVTTFGVPRNASSCLAAFPVDGPATSATFCGPAAVAVTKGGDVVILDSFTSSIRVLSPSGISWGLGAARSTQIVPGKGGAIDLGGLGQTRGAGGLGGPLAPTGAIVFTLAGGQGQGYKDGAYPSTAFQNVQSIALDSVGNVIVADSFSLTSPNSTASVIRKVSPAGTVTTIAGLVTPYGVGFDGVGATVDGVGTSASFAVAFFVAVNEVTGDILVADATVAQQ